MGTKVRKVTNLGSKSFRITGAFIASAFVLVGAFVAPVEWDLPSQAYAAEPEVNSVDVPVEDMAVTEKTFEQVEVPEGYTEGQTAEAEQVSEERLQVRPLETAAAPEEGVELSLARALISSPSAVFGVTFPLDNADEEVAITYRERQGEQWSEWKPMELADVAESPHPELETIVGTEPMTVVDVDELEVSVIGADKRSLPGVKLTVIEPELEADDLEETQLEEHGAEAVADNESVIPIGEQNVVPKPVTQQTPATSEEKGSTAPASKSESFTPAEEAEAYADLTLPSSAGNGQGIGMAATFRATGLTPNGQAYVTTIPGLTITTRKGWGADESYMDWDPEPITFKGAVVHHTAGTNNYTKEQVPNLIRGIYRYHAVSLGWGDIGYHILVDKFGGVWEGRSGGLTKAVEGGHAYGANSATFGISVLGDYMQVLPSDEAIDSVAKAIAWKFKVHGIKDFNAMFRVPGKQWGKSSIMLPVISAHRDVGGTTCPGDAFMKRMPEVRTKVSEYMDDVKSSQQTDQSKTQGAGTKQAKPQARWDSRIQIGNGWPENMYFGGAFSGAGATDAFLIDDKGKLWLYPGYDYGKFPYGRKQIGQGWGSMDQLNSGIDFNGDGYSDIVARANNGDLRLYPGNGRGGFKKSYKIGHGWGGFKQIIVTGTLSSAAPTVLGIRADGRLYTYTTNGKGVFTSSTALGWGWDTMRSLVSVGDKTGDGRADMLAIDQHGQMWLYEGDGQGRLGKRQQVGFGWIDFSPVYSVNDNGLLWSRSSDGRLWKYNFRGVF